MLQLGPFCLLQQTKFSNTNTENALAPMSHPFAFPSNLLLISFETAGVAVFSVLIFFISFFVQGNLFSSPIFGSRKSTTECTPLSLPAFLMET